MQTPYAQKRDLTQVEVSHARRSSSVYANIFDRLERIEEALVEQAEKQSRGTKLSGRTAEISEDIRNR
jgi:hypothetical protein